MTNKTYDAKKMEPWVKIVEALNALGDAGQGLRNAIGVVGTADMLTELGFTDGDYSVIWDGEFERWTLVSESIAPDLCPFNQTRDECSETDLCTQCEDVQLSQIEAADAEDAYYGR